MLRQHPADAWGRWPAALAVVLLFGISGAAFASESSRRPTPELRSADEDLAGVLDAMIRRGVELAARGDLAASDRIWAKIRSEYPEHPAGWMYAVDTLDWRKNLDITVTSFDPQIREHADRALALSQAWLKRAPDSTDAHLYAGRALNSLMRLNGMQGSLYRAGSQGEESRKHLERVLELEPKRADAKLPLGSYYYYASIATRYIRWLAWLWFVPTGEHDLGLQYVQEASRDGDLQRFEASVTLQRIYLYMEHTPSKAEPILLALIERYPENSYLRFELVELYMMLEDYPRTVAAALALESSSGTHYGDVERRHMAAIWRARAELNRGLLAQANAALDSLDPVWDELSIWGQRWVMVTRGQLDDVEGRREQAIEHYEQVVATRKKTRWGSERSMRAAEAGLERPFQLLAVSAAATDAGEPVRSPQQP